jgi:predicted transcriptional regulator
MYKHSESEKEDTLRLFLKLLWETTQTPTVIQLQKTMRDLHVANESRVLTILLQKGIIKRTHLKMQSVGNRSTYHWVSKTEPNIKMVKAILNEINNMWRKQKWPLNIRKTGLFY